MLFVGDSITDCNRDYSSRGTDLGYGYVSLINNLLHAHYPHLQFQVLNTGISGNRVTDLKARWQRDVLELRPDYLSIMIGINDVWRQFDSPELEQVDLSAYCATLSALIDSAKARTKGVILCSPFLLEANRQEPMRAMMDVYRSAAKALAGEKGLDFVDVQEAFDSWMQYQPASVLADDRVHPNAIGHQIIASAILKQLSFEF